MDLNLDNKVVLVSGSSRGIGKVVAKSFLNEGATVYLTGRNRENLEATFAEFKKNYESKVFKFESDLQSVENIRNLIKKIIEEHKRLDIVVANIGSGRQAKGWDITDKGWADSFNTNFFSAVHLSTEAIRVMLENGSGSIVFISSIAGCEAIPAPLPYSTAKTALLSYMKNTSDLVAQHGIRLNSISPGNVYFEGGTWDLKIKEQDKKEIDEYIHKAVPMQRFGSPEEVADAICFLASQKASFITGANLIIDGGQTRKIL